MKELIIQEDEDSIVVYFMGVSPADHEEFNEAVDRWKPALRTFGKNILFNPTGASKIKIITGADNEANL